MNSHSLGTIVGHLEAQLDCTQDVACWQILPTWAEIGQPLSSMRLV